MAERPEKEERVGKKKKKKHRIAKGRMKHTGKKH